MERWALCPPSESKLDQQDVGGSNVLECHGTVLRSLTSLTAPLRAPGRLSYPSFTAAALGEPHATERLGVLGPQAPAKPAHQPFEPRACKQLIQPCLQRMPVPTPLECRGPPDTASDNSPGEPVSP